MPAEAVLKIEQLTHVYPNGVRALDDGVAGHPARAVRPARPERRRQVDADAHDRDPAGRRPRGAIRFGDIDVIARPDRAAPHAGLPAAGLRRLPARLGLRHARPHGGAEGHRRRAARARSGRASAEPGQPVGRAQEGARRLLRRHAPALRHRPGADRRSRADHRRRAHRRPRPGGAQPLPQPAGRDRRERRRDPLDPHRRGRLRPLPAHGDHRRRPDRARRRAARPDRRAEGPDLDEDHRARPSSRTSARAIR